MAPPFKAVGMLVEYLPEVACGEYRTCCGMTIQVEFVSCGHPGVIPNSAWWDISRFCYKLSQKHIFGTIAAVRSLMPPTCRGFTGLSMEPPVGDLGLGVQRDSTQCFPAVSG